MQAVRELAVVSRRRGRKLIAAAVAAALLAIGYALGAHVGELGAHRPDAAEASGPAPPIGPLVASPAQSVTARVEAGANERLRRTVKALRDRIGALEEELRFYQRLVAPSEARRGFHIADWAVSSTETPAEYAYSLLLTQIVDRHQPIAGALQVDIVGDRDGASKTLPLRDLAVGGDYPAVFEFLYFQDFNGRMALPEGFAPRHIEVAAQLADAQQPPWERVFDWRVEEE